MKTSMPAGFECIHPSCEHNTHRHTQTHTDTDTHTVTHIHVTTKQQQRYQTDAPKSDSPAHLPRSQLYTHIKPSLTALLTELKP